MSSFQVLLLLTFQKQDRPHAHTHTAAVNVFEIACFYPRLLLSTVTSTPVKFPITKALAAPESCQFCRGSQEVTSPGTFWHYQTKVLKHSCLLTQKTAWILNQQLGFAKRILDSLSSFTFCQQAGGRVASKSPSSTLSRAGALICIIHLMWLSLFTWWIFHFLALPWHANFQGEIIRLQWENWPEEFVQVSVLHVFEHHDERVSIYTHAVEFNNVVVLQVGQQLRLPLEVLPGRQVGIFQGLKEEVETLNYKRRKVNVVVWSCLNPKA